MENRKDLFFIMTQNAEGHPVAVQNMNLEEGEYEVTIFDTYVDALKLALRQILCRNYGFTIIRWNGVRFAGERMTDAQTADALAWEDISIHGDLVAALLRLRRGAENDSPDFDYGWDAAINRIAEVIQRGTIL